MGIIQDNAGGGGIYVGKGHLWAVTQLHWRIYSRFTGDNHFALAQEFDKSERQIYTIVGALPRDRIQAPPAGPVRNKRVDIYHRLRYKRQITV